MHFQRGNIFGEAWNDSSPCSLNPKQTLTRDPSVSKHSFDLMHVQWTYWCLVWMRWQCYSSATIGSWFYFRCYWSVYFSEPIFCLKIYLLYFFQTAYKKFGCKTDLYLAQIIFAFCYPAGDQHFMVIIYSQHFINMFSWS